VNSRRPVATHLSPRNISRQLEVVLDGASLRTRPLRRILAGRVTRIGERQSVVNRTLTIRSRRAAATRLAPTMSPESGFSDE
jgi:hypothetical protein